MIFFKLLIEIKSCFYIIFGKAEFAAASYELSACLLLNIDYRKIPGCAACLYVQIKRIKPLRAEAAAESDKIALCFRVFSTESAEHFGIIEKTSSAYRDSYSVEFAADPAE